MDCDKVIYTALFGNYEELKEPKVVTPGWRYICYTDQPLTSKIWEIRKVDLNGEDPRRLARYFKIMEWVDWKQSIWIDASFIIGTNLDDWWSRYFKNGFSAPVHPFRDGVYAEILACILMKSGDVKQLQDQDKEYRDAKVPEFGGIISSGLLMRENTPEVIKLCEDWWNELRTRSIRDQVSFARVHFNHLPVCSFYHWDYTREKDFIYMQHFNRR